MGFISYVELWSKLDNVDYHVKRKQKAFYEYMEHYLNSDKL